MLNNAIQVSNTIENSNYYYNFSQPLKSYTDEKNIRVALELGEQLRSAHSIKNDLEEASVSIFYWKREWEENNIDGRFEENSHSSFIASSLLKNAIIAYVRAVDGGNLGRVNFPIDQLMVTPELKSAHERIVWQRNQSIAHHGIERSNIKKWSEHRIIFSENVKNETVKFMFPWKITKSSTETGLDLKLCLEAAQPIILSWHEKTRRKLIVKLQWLHENNLLEHLKQNNFDPDKFFSEPMTAEEWRQNAASENLRFSLRRPKNGKISS